MFDILFSYDFLVVALGTSILAVASAMLGCFSVYKGQSLVGDAVGHAAYPGVVLAYMVFRTRNPMLLMLGAVFTSGLAYFCIQLIVNNSKVKLDAALAIVLSGFFGLGMVLKTYTQGNPHYANASQAGLKNYIFGSAAFITRDDVILISVCSVLSIGFMIIFLKELSISIFDREYAKAVGLNTALIDLIMLIIMIMLISLGLKSVGAVLISSFLIIPCVCARQWSKKLSGVLLAAIFAGVFSSFMGTLFSSSFKGLSTGPMIIIFMSVLTGFSMIFGKYGIIKRRIKRE